MPTDEAHQVALDAQLKISQASHAGVPLPMIADYLGLTLEQVEAVVAVDHRFRKAKAEFDAWIEANKDQVGGLDP